MCKKLIVVILITSVLSVCQISLQSKGYREINFNTFNGAGFAPAPASGQLNSNEWKVSGLSDGDMSFGESRESDDFARGICKTGTNTGGVFAIQVAENDFALGAQPTTSDFTPGAFILRIKNDTGGELTKLNVVFEMVFLNDKDRSTSFDLYYSANDADYSQVASASLITPELADSPAVWQKNKISVSLPLKIAAGAMVYLKWQSDDSGDGAGSRDEIGLDNIRISAGDEATPVEMGPYGWSEKSGSVVIEWITSTEINNLGFEVERSVNRMNWEMLEFIRGRGNSNVPVKYSFIDKYPGTSGKLYYRLKQIDIDGASTYHSEMEVCLSAPVKFEMSQNYPNPFNPSTKIDFNIPQKNYVTVKVFDTMGRLVDTLFEGEKDAGYHTVDFNAAGKSSGIYFCRLQAGNVNILKQMILQK